MSESIQTASDTSAAAHGEHAVDEKSRTNDSGSCFLTCRPGSRLLCPFTADVDLAGSRIVGRWRSDAPVVVGGEDVVPKRNKQALADADAAPYSAPQMEMIYRSLPTFFRTAGHRSEGGKEIISTTADVSGFVKVDLDVSRLNQIHPLLWMAGRPIIMRPLHRHRMLGRNFILTDQADLHMLVDDNQLFLKPLPLYLVSRRFWKQYLCSDPALHKNSCGMLVSWGWMVRTELDFSIATDEKLLPRTNPPISWEDWKDFISSLHKHIDQNTLTEGVVNKRYLFGELRLGRINSIYRLAPQFFFQHFVRGYLYGYNRYSVFFQRRIAWLLILFIWLEVVLSAMDVGLSVDKLVNSAAFVEACYGFVIFSMTLVLAVIVFAGTMFGSMYLINMFLAIRHSRKVARQRHRAIIEKQGDGMS